jgi:hypothetical protein
MVSSSPDYLKQTRAGTGFSVSVMWGTKTILICFLELELDFFIKAKNCPILVLCLILPTHGKDNSLVLQTKKTTNIK